MKANNAAAARHVLNAQFFLFEVSEEHLSAYGVKMNEHGNTYLDKDVADDNSPATACRTRQYGSCSFPPSVQCVFYRLVSGNVVSLRRSHHSFSLSAEA